MRMRSRPIDETSIEELKRYHVWEYDLDEEAFEDDQDESWIALVDCLPVTNLGNRLVVTEVNLAGGVSVAAMLGSIRLGSPRATKQFLSLRVAKEGYWFDLARYYEIHDESESTADLCEFPGLPPGEVFPISYDISDVAVGHPEVLRGCITEVPGEILNATERRTLNIDTLEL